jgi:hypothetical protein
MYKSVRKQFKKQNTEQQVIDYISSHSKAKIGLECQHISLFQFCDF